MGIKVKDAKVIYNTTRQYFDKLKKLSLVELGEQELKIWHNETNDKLINNFVLSNPRIWPEKPPCKRLGFFSKDFLETLFKTVVVIDVVKHCPKTLDYDLGVELRTQRFNSKFNVLTNFGTTEHVGELKYYKNPQYHAYKNIHNIVIQGGLMFHNVPQSPNKKSCSQHGAFNYDKIFFMELAKACNYEVIFSTMDDRGGLKFVSCCLRKNDDSNFITEKMFNTLSGLYPTKKRRRKSFTKYLKTFFLE